MCTKKYLTALTLLAVVQQISSNAMDSDHFGPYDLCLESVNICPGTEKNNLSESYISHRINENGKSVVTSNLTLFEDAGIAMLKMDVLKWNGEKFVPMTTFSSKNMCENVLFKKFFLDRFFKFVPGEPCTMQKGFTTSKDLDVKDFSTHVFGDKFFYGKLKTNLQFYTPKGIISCTKSITSVVKPNTCKIPT